MKSSQVKFTGNFITGFVHVFRNTEAKFKQTKSENISLNLTAEEIETQVIQRGNRSEVQLSLIIFNSEWI